MRNCIGPAAGHAAREMRLASVRRCVARSLAARYFVARGYMVEAIGPKEASGSPQICCCSGIAEL
ncbi:hypothetical protein BRAS3809_5860002 [Bradyrhizobium sp. STM 3809]|nr:hypothetical protein BRAS3809_5860002 [Bradyrhizobium sp. STM 3809]